MAIFGAGSMCFFFIFFMYPTCLTVETNYVLFMTVTTVVAVMKTYVKMMISLVER